MPFQPTALSASPCAGLYHTAGVGGGGGTNTQKCLGYPGQTSSHAFNEERCALEGASVFRVLSAGNITTWSIQTECAHVGRVGVYCIASTAPNPPAHTNSPPFLVSCSWANSPLRSEISFVMDAFSSSTSQFRRLISSTWVCRFESHHPMHGHDE